jgi:hypothetical protein
MYVIAFVHVFDDAPELGRVMLAETEEEAIKIACDMVRSEYKDGVENYEGSIAASEHELATMTTDDWLSSEGYRSSENWSVCIGIPG